MPSHDVLIPTAVATSLRFTELAVGLQHACSIPTDGTVYCWGDNSYQQLGTLASLPTCQELDGPCSPTPLALEGRGTYQHVAASLRDSCALNASGEIWCWGFGVGGQLGDGQRTNSPVPVPVRAAVPFSAIALGGSGLLACALGPAGSGYCWGPDGAGGLGNGTTAGSDAPAVVSGAFAFGMLTVGDDHACGITAPGAGYCWGDDEYGDLGKGSPGASSVPAPVSGGLGFTMLSAGLAHTCGLTTDGSAYCWGFPPAVGSGQNTNGPLLAPLPVAGGGHSRRSVLARISRVHSIRPAPPGAGGKTVAAASGTRRLPIALNQCGCRPMSALSRSGPAARPAHSMVVAEPTAGAPTPLAKRASHYESQRRPTCRPTPAAVIPLPVGSEIPAAVVRNPDGTDRRVGPGPPSRPTVLIFYRGGWCPYCNRHPGALKKVEPQLIKLGYDLLFLSADRPEILYSSLKEPDVHYTLLSDASMSAARAYHVAYHLDAAAMAKYGEYGVDLEAASGQQHHQLPVPAVFIIDRAGVIRFVYANPDYTVRMAPEALFEGAQQSARGR